MAVRPLSLATRLTLLFGVAAAVVFAIFGWVISREMEEHFEEGDMAELEIIATAVEGALSDVRSPSDLAPVQRRFDDILIGHHSASLYIANDDGPLVYVSSAQPDLSGIARETAETLDDDTVRLWRDASHTYSVLIRRMGGAPPALPDAYTIVVATPIDHHLVFLASFRRTLWLMIASSIVLMSVMGWAAVRQGHAPLREIVGRMRLVSANERARSIPPDSVPRELSDLAVSFNEMLQRALGNLLSNAIRHTPSGGTVRVALGQSQDGTLSISVVNPGTPIPAENLPNLFDRFYRVDPSRQRRGEGAGLGLAIVKSIVDSHRGKIDVTSRENRTTFHIVLPAG